MFRIGCFWRSWCKDGSFSNRTAGITESIESVSHVWAISYLPLTGSMYLGTSVEWRSREYCHYPDDLAYVFSFSFSRALSMNNASEWRTILSPRSFFVYPLNRSHLRSRGNSLSSNDFIRLFSAIFWDRYSLILKPSSRLCLIVSHVSFSMPTPSFDQEWRSDGLEFSVGLSPFAFFGYALWLLADAADSLLVRSYTMHSGIQGHRRVHPSLPIDRFIPIMEKWPGGLWRYKRASSSLTHRLEPNSFSVFLKLHLVTSREWQKIARVRSGPDPKIVGLLLTSLSIRSCSVVGWSYCRRGWINSLYSRPFPS